MAHPELHATRALLHHINVQIAHFKPLTARPPILDSSYDNANEVTEENQWLHQENVPGLKKLKETIKLDLGALDKFLEDPNCVNLPPLSTNAPYLIAVWNEVVCAPPPTVSIFKTFHVANLEKSGKKFEKITVPGVKVDVVAENGRRWIRVNTIKNSRMLSEFREIDSYLTDSDEDSDDGDWDNIGRPSLAQTEFDNSLLRMGRSLLAAAEANCIEGTTETPTITLRLTRLNPDSNEDGSLPDPRIAQTISMLKDMGIEVELGERSETEIPELSSSTDAPIDSVPITFLPTRNINLDLSALIALISDLTHAPLPGSIEQANRRFVPPQEYREWKVKRLAMIGKAKAKSQTNGDSSDTLPGLENDINDLPGDLIKHSRALTNQLLQEMSAGLLQEIHDRIAASSPGDVVFWTTAEARDRCLRIVSKIGGIHEKRRARALFCFSPDPESNTEIPLEEAQKAYWQDSRFSTNFIPLLPIRIFPSSSPHTSTMPELAQLSPSPFGVSIGQVCDDLLSQETVPHPRAIPNINSSSASLDNTCAEPHNVEIQRASVTKANPRLTAHTVQSMRWGAELGWTTLTANRSSVKAILRELKAARTAGRLRVVGQSIGIHEDEKEEETSTQTDAEKMAAFWVIDPRSLAEGMSSFAPADDS
ncbi:hypothetical protein BDN70DRAFT_818263 [Pholiota conissans]|uniref:DUF1308 domain-containing protein n=1 Tax=Pholiota conissans TaxID=109636 RepID=A0A9P6CT57_9AGAR|nr:hypothetical protein BDN70DRAFT_818263 [Pholiota conissans]